jgi:hypothetical protein
VNYADDFVILCRRNAGGARERMEAIMAKKTRVCGVPEESFESLGYALLGDVIRARRDAVILAPEWQRNVSSGSARKISLLTRRTIGSGSRRVGGSYQRETARPSGE